MAIGSIMDDIELIRLVESLGAQVVIDDHCTGSRYFWNGVTLEEDRLTAIASRYIDRPPCPVTDLDGRLRLDHVLKLAKDYNVQGVLLLQQRFCELHEYDMAFMRPMFMENGIPVLWLEMDVTTPLGQFRTRLEAFMETLLPELV